MQKNKVEETLKAAEKGICILPKDGRMHPLSDGFINVGLFQEVTSSKIKWLQRLMACATGGKDFLPGVNLEGVETYIKSRFTEEEINTILEHLEFAEGNLAATDEDNALVKRFQQACREIDWLYHATYGGKVLVELLALSIDSGIYTDISVSLRASMALFYYFFLYGYEEEKKWMPTDSVEMKERGLVSEFEMVDEQKRVLNMKTPDRVIELMEMSGIEYLGTYEYILCIIQELAEKDPDLLEYALNLCSNFCLNEKCYEDEPPHTWWEARLVRMAIYELMKDDEYYMTEQ